MAPVEPSHRRGKAVDDKILAAVIAVIENVGTLAIRVDEVAEVAGVNKTTIYRRFPSRDDLVLAAVLAQAEQVVPIPDTGSLETDLFEIAKLVRATVTSPLGRALLSASAETSELAGQRTAYWETRFDAASKVIERAVGCGACPPQSDAPLIIELMVAPIHFRATQIGKPISDDYLQLQVDRALSQLTRGSGAVGPKTRKGR